MDWKDLISSNSRSGAEWLMWEIISYNYATLVTNENFKLEIPIKILKQKCEQAKEIELQYTEEKVREAMIMVMRSMADLPFAKGDAPTSDD